MAARTASVDKPCQPPRFSGYGIVGSPECEFVEGFGEPWWSLANLKTYRFSDTEVARIEAEAALERAFGALSGTA